MNDLAETEQMRADALSAAAAVADLLLTKDNVSDVQLAEVPHWLDGPPYYTGPKYRIIAIVSDEAYEQYLAWILEPFTVHYQDAADGITASGDVGAIAVWWTERPSTTKEAAWRTLGETIGEASDDSNAYGFYIRIVWTPDGKAEMYGACDDMATTFWNCADFFDVIPLRRNWQDDVKRLDTLAISHTQDEEEHSYLVFNQPPRQNNTWRHAAENHLVYDPIQQKFVSPR